MRPAEAGAKYSGGSGEWFLAGARQRVPADEVEEAAVAPAGAARSRRGALRESSPPPFDRRRPDVVSDEVDSRRRFRLPWIGIAGSGAAAAAVMIVAIILFQRQQEWLQAPRPASVGERESSARVVGGAPKARRKTAAPGAAADGKVAGNKKQAAGSAVSEQPSAGAKVSEPAPSATKMRSDEGESGTVPPAAITAPTAEQKLQTDTHQFEERTRDEAGTPPTEKDASQGGEVQ